MPGGAAGGRAPVKLKTVAKIAAGVAAVLLALIVAAVLSFDWSLKKAVVGAVQGKTGLPFTIGKLRLGLLDGTLHVQDLKLGNPPEFGPLPLLSIPEIYFAYDLEAAKTNGLAFREVRLNFDQVSMVVDAQGRTNLTEIAARLDKAGLSQSRPLPTNMLNGMTFAGIGKLQISLGQVNLADLRTTNPPQAIVIGLTNQVFTNVTDLTPLAPLVFKVLARTMFQLR